MTPNIKERGYNKTVEIKRSNVVEIENFLNSPFPCIIIKKIELKKLAEITIPNINETKKNNHIFSGDI